SLRREAARRLSGGTARNFVSIQAPVLRRQEKRVMKKELAEGDKAPGFSLESSSGTVSLADFSGETVVVYFYPKDLTPGCTTEAIDFHKARTKLAKKGAAVLGISRDSVATHEKFADKCDLGFPLLSDPGGKVTKAWGAWGEKTLYGKKT